MDQRNVGSSLGAIKTAAARVGVSVAEYERRRDNGEKWCRVCRNWHRSSAFNADRSRGDGLAPLCTEAQRRLGRERYEPKGRPANHGQTYVWTPGKFDHVLKVGKKAAGRELDGRTWDEYPAAAGIPPTAPAVEHTHA